MINQRIIWIIDPYSELPEEGMRLGRYHQMAEALIFFGYTVKVFISNFSHRTKKIQNSSSVITLKSGIEYHIVNSLTYKSHISVKRIFYEKIFIKNVVYSYVPKERPDLIVIRDPAIFISKTLISFVKKNHIKYIVDIIDLWPELFEIVLPKKLQKYSKVIFSLFYNRRSRLLKGASGYSAVSPDYLKIATDINGMKPSEVIYWGCDYQKIKSISSNKDSMILDKFNLKKEECDFWLIYSGTLGDNYDIKLILYVSDLLQFNCNIKFIIAGSGPLHSWIKNYIDNKKPNNLFFIGDVKSIDLYSLFAYCDIGLTTYSKKSTVSMPIKAYDYFSAGLPIINSLNRNLGKIINEKNLGYNYMAEDIESFKSAILEAYLNQDELNLKKNNVMNTAHLFDQKNQYQLFGQLVDNVVFESVK